MDRSDAEYGMLNLMGKRIRERELGAKRRTEEEHLRAKPGLPIWDDRLGLVYIMVYNVFYYRQMHMHGQLSSLV